MQEMTINEQKSFSLNQGTTTKPFLGGQSSVRSVKLVAKRLVHKNSGLKRFCMTDSLRLVQELSETK